MSEFTKIIYNKVLNLSEGLPLFSQLFLLKSINHINVLEGVIKLPTLQEFIRKSFHVEKAPGRKQELVTPETLRNAFRTIKKFRGEHFIFKTEGQRIVIEMPFIRELYAEHLKSKEVAAVSSEEDGGSEPLDFTDFDDDFSTAKFKEDTEEVTAVSSSYINKQNKTTKQTRTEISADFYPSRETILLAESRGLEKVTDEEEIKKFIHFNQANKTHWVDFNPVFIRWLEREAEYREQQAEKKEEQEQQQTQNKEQQGTRRIGHAGASNKRKSFAEQRAEVYEKNKDALDPDEPYLPADDAKRELIEATHFLALDTPYRTVYQPLYQQIR